MNSHALAVLTFLAVTAPALAQGTPHSKTTGFMLGFGLNGTSVKFESDDSGDNGSGATLQVGYGFTSRFTGLIDVSGVVLDGDPGEGEVSLAQIFALGRFNFGDESKRWRPFVDVGLGVRGFGQKNAQVCTASGCTTGHDVSFSGGAFAFGGGTSFYATRKLAITGALTWGVGEFSDFTVDNVTTSGFESDATTGRVNIGVTWFPGG